MENNKHKAPDPELEKLEADSNKCSDVVMAMFENPVNDYKEMLKMEIFLDEWLPAGFKVNRTFTKYDKDTKNMIITLIRED